MTTINTWINFNGNAKEAFEFYKSVFGGEFGKIVYMRDIATTGFPVGEVDADKILKISLPIGNNNTLTGNDVPSFFGKVNQKENRSKISVNVDSKKEAETFFNSLSVDGEIEYPLGESPWGTYYGSFRDKYGIEWMVESNQ